VNSRQVHGAARLSLGAVCLLIVGCREAVIHDLEELQANRIAVVLAAAQIPATKAREGAKWSILVPSPKVGMALSAIEESRAVRPAAVKHQKSTGLILSREERAIMIERSASAALEQTLERLPEVREARVHLHLPSSYHFELAPAAVRGSGSVLIVASPTAAVNISHVKELVASAAGIAAEAVTVVIAPVGQLAPERPEKSGTSPMRQEGARGAVAHEAVAGLDSGLRLPVANMKKAAAISGFKLLFFCGVSILFLLFFVKRMQQDPSNAKKKTLERRLRPAHCSHMKNQDDDQDRPLP